VKVVHSICCGLDVHAKTVVACLIKGGEKERRTFSTMTDDLVRLKEWLIAAECPRVGIESTGVYWRPVFNVLEGRIEVLLLNARDVKGRRGRKTDMLDSEWIAEMVQFGLVEGSFIPPANIRELRELTRYRESLVRQRTNLANRIQKLIESGNIKLGQVATDVFGTSGRAMLRSLAEGQSNPQELASLARGRLKSKQTDLARALQGQLTDTQRWILKQLLDQYEHAEIDIAVVEERLAAELANNTDPFAPDALALLQTVPGIGEKVASVIIAEIGLDMTRFPTAGHLASWAGLCPGNHESAGKRSSGRTTKGNAYLRTRMVQAAWAATRTRNTYLAAQYRRLVKRMGAKKALVAVAHTMLIMVYHILKRREPFRELGGDYFERRSIDDQRKSLVRKLESLGFSVTIAPLLPEPTIAEASPSEA
jgi:transposase